MVAAQDAETTPLLISKKRDAFSSSASWKKKSIVVGAFFVAVACFAVVVGTIRDRGKGAAPFYSLVGNTPRREEYAWILECNRVKRETCSPGCEFR